MAFLRDFGGEVWTRCPIAELWEDQATSGWIELYWDHQRMNVRPPSLDMVPAVQVDAFRVIEGAMADVRERERKKAEDDRKSKERKDRSAGRSSGRGMVRRHVAHKARPFRRGR